MDGVEKAGKDDRLQRQKGQPGESRAGDGQNRADPLSIREALATAAWSAIQRCCCQRHRSGEDAEYREGDGLGGVGSDLAEPVFQARPVQCMLGRKETGRDESRQQDKPEHQEGVDQQPTRHHDGAHHPIEHPARREVVRIVSEVLSADRLHLVELAGERELALVQPQARREGAADVAAPRDGREIIHGVEELGLVIFRDYGVHCLEDAETESGRPNTAAGQAQADDLVLARHLGKRVAPLVLDRLSVVEHRNDVNLPRFQVCRRVILTCEVASSFVQSSFLSTRNVKKIE